MTGWGGRRKGRSKGGHRKGEGQKEGWRGHRKGEGQEGGVITQTGRYLAYIHDLPSEAPASSGHWKKMCYNSSKHHAFLVPGRVNKGCSCWFF